MLVRVPADEDIAVQLSLHGSKGLHVTPRDNLVAVDNANLKVVDLDYFGFGQAWHFITVTLDNVGLTFSGSQVLKPLDHLLLYESRVNLLKGKCLPL